MQCNTRDPFLYGIECIKFDCCLNSKTIITLYKFYRDIVTLAVVFDSCISMHIACSFDETNLNDENKKKITAVFHKLTISPYPYSADCWCLPKMQIYFLLKCCCYCRSLFGFGFILSCTFFSSKLGISVVTCSHACPYSQFDIFNRIIMQW